MFIDRAVVRVAGGTGGSGASSFARFKYKPKGGPDGGDGGHGGSIYVRADANLATLLDYRYRTVWKAERGEHGKGKTKTGASTDDVFLPVPPGTIIRDADTGELLGEVLKDGDSLLVARGGRGGRGNARFATPTHQAPREWEPGEEGQERQIELVLKLIADVGLVGEPNAGIHTKECRSNFINYYFGDSAVKSCGVCDNCLQLKASHLTTEEFEKIKTSIHTALSGEKLVTAALFTKLNGINKEKARSVLNFLQAEQKILINEKGEICLC